MVGPARRADLTPWPRSQSLVAPFGLDASLGRYALANDSYLGGTDAERASDVNAAFASSSGVQLVVANRGGYGCARILDAVDFAAVSRARVPLMGFSDLTSLLNAVHTRTGLLAFHGPMGYATWSATTADYVRRVVLEGGEGVVLSNSAPGYPAPTTVRGGKATGRLVGGNLSVFVSLLGTPYLPAAADMRGRVLFLEEVGEAPYRVDRMLESLRLAGYLEAASAVVFGACTSCTASGGSFTWQEVVRQKLEPLGTPCFFGAMFGHHLPSMYVLPIGALAEVDADAGTITLLQRVTRARG